MQCSQTPALKIIQPRVCLRLLLDFVWIILSNSLKMSFICLLVLLFFEGNFQFISAEYLIFSMITCVEVGIQTVNMDNLCSGFMSPEFSRQLSPCVTQIYPVSCVFYVVCGFSSLIQLTRFNYLIRLSCSVSQDRILLDKSSVWIFTASFSAGICSLLPET